MPQVKEKFTDKNGNFDENAFQSFYTGVQDAQNQMASIDYVGNIEKNLPVDPYDWMSGNNLNIREYSASVFRGINPERRSFGVSGVGSIGDRAFSDREIGQWNRVRSADDKELDYTPDDLSLEKGKLFSNIFKKPLVLAQYDENGFHKENGIDVEHHKGELKRDKYGDTYYEELGDRSARGRQVLHITDNLTIDGSTLNEFDLFDADGTDQALYKTLLGAAVKITP